MSDALGETALFEAAASGNADIVTSLLLALADPSRRSLNGMVASDMAEYVTIKTLISLFQGWEVEDHARDDALATLSLPLQQSVMACLRNWSGAADAETE